MKIFTISGLEHLVQMFAQHPEFLALASLVPLQEVARKAKEASKSCGCHAAGVYQTNRPVFENCLLNMSNGDHVTVKKILGVDQICYYVKDSSGGLKRKCF